MCHVLSCANKDIIIYGGQICVTVPKGGWSNSFLLLSRKYYGGPNLFDMGQIFSYVPNNQPTNQSIMYLSK